MKKRGVEGLKKEELVKERLQMWLGLARLRVGVMVTEMNTRGGVQLRARLPFWRVNCHEICKYVP